MKKLFVLLSFCLMGNFLSGQSSWNIISKKSPTADQESDISMRNGNSECIPTFRNDEIIQTHYLYFCWENSSLFSQRSAFSESETISLQIEAIGENNENLLLGQTFEDLDYLIEFPSISFDEFGENCFEINDLFIQSYNGIITLRFTVIGELGFSTEVFEIQICDNDFK